jgi:hypothetical protein
LSAVDGSQKTLQNENTVQHAISRDSKYTSGTVFPYYTMMLESFGANLFITPSSNNRLCFSPGTETLRLDQPENTVLTFEQDIELKSTWVELA